MIDPYIAIFLAEKTIELSPKIAQAAQGLWGKVKRKRIQHWQHQHDNPGDDDNNKNEKPATPNNNNNINDKHSETMHTPRSGLRGVK